VRTPHSELVLASIAAAGKLILSAPRITNTDINRGWGAAHLFVHRALGTTLAEHPNRLTLLVMVLVWWLTLRKYESMGCVWPSNKY
jgi:hypothetical protein